MNTINRKLTAVYAAQPQQGFLGKGHTAWPVIQVDFTQSDPFIILADDRLDKTDNVPVGGPHPHAGFETVTLVLEGEMGEGPLALKQGDFEMMTAGSGVIHTEILARPMQMRILQLWLNLPKKDREASPRVQRLEAGHVPNRSNDGVTLRVYSGTFAGISSPVRNHTPLILVDITLAPGAQLTDTLPADFSTFLYVIGGSVQVGDSKEILSVDHVGWLDRTDVHGESVAKFAAGPTGARFILYAAQPTYDEIVSHGPFIADSTEEIRRLYADYRAGKMGHITEVPPEQQLVY